MGKKRIDYGLSEETIKVVSGNVEPLADALRWSKGYVYGIVEGYVPDPFAYFDPFYEGCVRAGLDYSIYDDRLSVAKAQNRLSQTCELSERDVLLKKVPDDALTTEHILAAFRDGKLTDKERKQLRSDVERLRQNCDLIEALLDFHAGDAAQKKRKEDRPQVRVEMAKSVERRNGQK